MTWWQFYCLACMWDLFYIFNISEVGEVGSNTWSWELGMAMDWSRTGDGNRLVQDWGWQQAGQDWEWKWADSRPSMAILPPPPLPIHDPVLASILGRIFREFLYPSPLKGYLLNLPWIHDFFYLLQKCLYYYIITLISL